jgi:hypothetical protein
MPGSAMHAATIRDDRMTLALPNASLVLQH